MTIEQLLAKKGYSAQEITDLGPMLQNARFRKDLEEELTGMETQLTKANTDLTEYDRWFTEDIGPEHQKLIKEHADAVAEAAASKAKFESYQRTSMMRQAGKTSEEIAAAEKVERDRIAAEAAASAGRVDPTKFVSSETFAQTYDKVGDAIAVATNIVSQHMQLFPGQFIDMEQLRVEAKAAKKPVKEFWESKYGVAAKRTELATKAEETKAEKYRQEGYQKAAQELGGNPNLRPLAPSTSPFVARKKADATKQPWEKSEADVARTRIDAAVQKAAARGELANA